MLQADGSRLLYEVITVASEPHGGHSVTGAGSLLHEVNSRS